MTYSPNQQLRRLRLLDKLAGVKREDPAALTERSTRLSSFDMFGRGGQEHQDIIALFRAGYIANRSFFSHNPTVQWSPEGIFAYDITAAGEEFLELNRYLLDDGALPVLFPPVTFSQAAEPARQDEYVEPSATSQATVFIIHGTDPNGYVRVVEDACRKFDLNSKRMMDQPNQGRTLPDKLRDNTTASDFYVAVLTHDETTLEGGQRARQNAIAETLLAHQNWPDRLAILREGEVEIPSNLQGVGYIQLEGQWSMALIQEFRAAGLV